ncbi:hypothetical protein V6N11_044929 [Hibiscus sabdariffa]|uniref:DUF4283 domain-containing protein n=1 Tax=Hibiscus sabdariffa TaxID=183260 RepID=A0ABR2PUC1_9ROSI
MPTRDTTLRAEGPLGCQSRRVDRVIDEEKLSVLETYALGWVKETVSMRVLSKETAVAGLDGFEIMWVAGSMVLLAFPDANSRQHLLSQDVLSTWFGCLEEWSAEYASRRAWLSISGLPIHLWSEGSFRTIVGLWGKYLWFDVAMEELTSFEWACILIETSVRGRIDEVVEVASLGTMFPIVVQEVELVRVPAVEQRGVVDGAALTERDSLGVKVVGDCESAEKYGRIVGVNGEGATSTGVLGLAGAAAAPVTRSAHGGARKVKSVNTLVEALGSPTQKRVIAAARSRRGHGRPAKISRVEEASGWQMSR